MYVRTNDRFQNGMFFNTSLRLDSVTTAAPRVLTYSTRDVIDSRISVPAQHSLVRLSKNPSTNSEAVAMLAEIKARRLAGIYCVNWKASAQRAIKLGKTWWTVIPREEDAVLMLDPANLSNGPPLIAFRRELDHRREQGCGLLQNEQPIPPSPARLDAALLKAWSSYRLWRGSGKPNGTAKCTIKPIGDDQVLAGPQLQESSSVGVLKNVVPPLFCLPGTIPGVNPQIIPCKAPDVTSICTELGLPKNLKCLKHFHVCKLVPQGTVTFRMVREKMNPGYVDVDGAARQDPQLQKELDDRIKSYKNKDRIAIALVDLTNNKLNRAGFAGWRETVPMNGASLAKISALYAVYQLKFDLNTLAKLQILTSETDLKTAAESMWSSAGLKKVAQPNIWTSERKKIGKFFDFQNESSTPVSVSIASDLQRHLKCIFEGNCNHAASVLIDEIGFPYISSVLWQSGLFHLKKSGLWLSAYYPKLLDCNHCTCNGAHFCKQFTSRSTAIWMPGQKFGFNVTALSTANFFTLMAQERLADRSTSLEIRQQLESACSLFCDLSCSSRTSVKCGCSASGCFSGDVHTGILIERNLGLECVGKQIRYVAVLLTNQVASTRAQIDTLFCEVLTDLDEIVQLSNP
jgi:hypothetical protein